MSKSPEKYQPTAEEIQKAEGMITPAQARASKYRELLGDTDALDGVNHWQEDIRFGGGETIVGHRSIFRGVIAGHEINVEAIYDHFSDNYDRTGEPADVGATLDGMDLDYTTTRKLYKMLSKEQETRSANAEKLDNALEKVEEEKEKFLKKEAKKEAGKETLKRSKQLGREDEQRARVAYDEVLNALEGKKEKN